MNIVHIGPSQLPILYPLGGAVERRMRELAVRQAASGARVVIYSAEDRDRSTEFHGVEVRAVGCGGRGVRRSFEFLIKALRDSQAKDADILHFHNVAEGAALAARHGGCKLLSYDFFEFRRGKRNPLFPAYRRALRRYSCLMPVSDYCRRESAAYWSLPAERLEVLHNGVDLRQFHPDPAAGQERRRLAGVREDELVVLYVGRVCPQKGTDLLLEACRCAAAEGRKLRLVVAGPVGQFGTAGGSDLTDRLAQIGGTYLGAVDEALLPAVYNMCDVFVMPTRAYEMFGMAALEAQACGKPVVCSNNGGLPEVIAPESGLLFDAGDGEGLARQLRRILENEALRRRLAQAAVGNARRFAWDRIVTRLDALYRGA